MGTDLGSRWNLVYSCSWVWVPGAGTEGGYLPQCHGWEGPTY